MHHLPCLSLVLVCLLSCAGNNFDEATIPPEQLGAEMAFRRVAEHGGLEPVLEEGTEFNDWQFHIASKSKTSVLGGKPTQVFRLKDRSGNGADRYTTRTNSSSAAGSIFPKDLVLIPFFRQTSRKAFACSGATAQSRPPLVCGSASNHFWRSVVSFT